MKALRGRFLCTGSKHGEMIQEVRIWKADLFPKCLGLLWESCDYKSTVREEMENTQEQMSSRPTPPITTKPLIRSAFEDKWELCSYELETFVKESPTAAFEESIKCYLSISVQQALHCHSKKLDVLLKLLCTFLQTENG